MKIKYNILIAALGLTLVVVALVAIYVLEGSRIDTSAVDYIYSMQKGPSKFLDLASDINVSSAEDVGFKVNADYDITIYYGDQVIPMNRNCFNSEEYRNLISKIGLKVYTRVGDDEVIQYRVTYWGDEIDQYSIVE